MKDINVTHWMNLPKFPYDGDFPFVGAVIIDAPKKLSPEDAKAFVKKFFEENKVLLKRIADG
jgi:hypothetical protein